ncbi:S49 family peptidase [Hongsoonwoonella zoysiae]|uniref:S49 family peptidase n=1 Tax=Hongsoonwoonella zoysiae TaxID=2821844 RepID=UPI0031B5E5A1
MLNKLRKYLPGKLGKTKPRVPVVRLHGAIGMSTPLRPGLTLSSCAQTLERAFKVKEAPAVALLVNSPGGSPVQSRLIYTRIRALAEEHKKDVLVFVEDVAASGGYMIAIAGDEIIADPSSIVGSIGVVSAGFGFNDLISKIGVERRVYTAGEKKVLLDPFRPERAEDVEHLKSLQQEIHETFTGMVKERRGDVLNEAEDVFSGLFWTGQKARDLGLIDQLGDLRSVIKERFGKDAEPTLYGAPRSIFPKRGGIGVDAPGGINLQGVGDDIISSLETRALWARYGL